MSMGGRLKFINSVLSSIPTYWILVFELPEWIILDIDKILRISSGMVRIQPTGNVDLSLGHIRQKIKGQECFKLTRF